MTRRRLDPEWQRARCELINQARQRGVRWREIADSMNLSKNYVRAMYKVYKQESHIPRLTDARPQGGG